MAHNFLTDYLNVDQPFNYDGKELYSTLVGALKEARDFSRRDLNTGKVIINKYEGHEKKDKNGE